MEKFTNQLHDVAFGTFYDTTPREILDGELIKKARMVEMETFKKHGVYENAPLDVCWRVIGKAPV